MEFDFVPLLQVLRDLYAMPRGMERFQAYIHTMTDADTGDLKLPLVAMNPMGRDHVPALLDELLALQADEVGAAAVAFSPVPGAASGAIRSFTHSREVRRAASQEITKENGLPL
jgi:hypothetical protein